MFRFFWDKIASLFLTGEEEPEGSLQDYPTQLEDYFTTPKILGQCKPIQREVEVFQFVQKSGIITHLCDEYGLIDDLFYFEPNQICDTVKPKLYEVVYYTAYKAKDNETERVHKITGLVNECWDCTDKFIPFSPKMEEKKIEEVAAFARVINGQVVEKKGRQLLIEPPNIWLNLDSVQTSFVPHEGDRVSLEAMVAVNDKAIDLSGDILEVTSLKPLLIKSGQGKVSLWSDVKKEGVIENFVYFTSEYCEGGYIPALGDEVTYKAVESDQGGYEWRAFNIICKSTKPNEEVPSDFQENGEAVPSKNGITIKPQTLEIKVGLYKTVQLDFEISNTGKTVQSLDNRNSKSYEHNSQIRLIAPTLQKNIILEPKDSVRIVLECRGKFLGFSKEVFMLCFENFKIAVNIRINVVNGEKLNDILSCTPSKTKKKKFLKSSFTPDVFLYGPKPLRAKKFNVEKSRETYKVPNKLLKIVGRNDGKCADFVVKNLEKYAPYLKKEITFSDYADRFHTLLYLEEIAIVKNMEQYNMNGVFLLRQDDYFVLEVPGLTERRPSLLCGDKVLLTQPWSEKNRIQYVGFIHHIKLKEIYIKFHKTFHATYDESECDIIFQPNTGSLCKCHDAINRSLTTLTKDWLFPSAVNEKSPQINLESVKDLPDLSPTVCNFFNNASKSFNGTSEKAFECRTQKIENIKNIVSVEELEISIKDELMISKKNIVWFNKNLNDRQKLAVVGALEARGRPLPYVIFGPPGTGKTKTLVEIVAQIYKILPASRLLIVSSSNSSADSLSKQLIDLCNFKPGELQRLLSYNRIVTVPVPVELAPYCSAVQSEESINEFKINKTIPLLSSVERSRIVVATCTCIASFHQMDFPRGYFTHIMIDEAGQVSEPELLIPATLLDTKNGHIVLAGDPLQLGPVCISKLAKDYGLGISFLQRLLSHFPYIRDFDSFPKTSGYDPRFITRLNVNYRTVPEILSLPNQLFYNSELISMISQTDSHEADIIRRLNLKVNRDDPAAIIFHGVGGINMQENDSPSWYNPHEIWIIVRYLKRIYDIGLTSDDVGIITPYIKQVIKLRSVLKSLNFSVPKIGSVETFQGQEHHVIIISFVRGSAFDLRPDLNSSLDFVSCPRRINVALTRARAVLIIIGNPYHLCKNRYLKKVVKYCVQNKSYTGCSLGPL